MLYLLWLGNVEVLKMIASKNKKLLSQETADGKQHTSDVCYKQTQEES